jgi:acyl-CoA thioesterase-1
MVEKRVFMKNIWVVLLTVLLWGCSETKEITTHSSALQGKDTPLTYLALGDSYTICEGMSTANRWPDMLVEKLNVGEQKWSAPTIIAKTGWTTSNLLDAVAKESIKENSYDMVSLLIGVNNQFQGLPYTVFQKEFDELLDLSILYCKDINAVFVVSIPDYGVTRYGGNNKEGIAKELDTYNAYMKKQSQALGVVFINVTEVSRALGASALADDELHPNADQYAEWVEVIFGVLRD